MGSRQAERKVTMRGTITIELITTIPDSGSGMPDLGHDVYWLMKELPNLEYKDTNGKMKRLSTKYEIASVRTEGAREPVAHPEPAGQGKRDAK
jgi:hypothetical protein